MMPNPLSRKPSLELAQAEHKPLMILSLAKIAPGRIGHLVYDAHSNHNIVRLCDVNFDSEIR